MLSDMRATLAKADNNDITIVFIGGHGNIGTLDNVKQYGAIVADTEPTTFFASYFYALAEEFNGIKVFIVDTCHSGALVEYFKSHPRSDVCVLAACKSDAQMHPMPNDMGTYMMKYFLKGIGYDVDTNSTLSVLAADSYARPTQEKDGKITFDEICDYVRDLVEFDTSDLSALEKKHTISLQEPCVYCPSALWDTVIYQRDSR